MQVYSWFGSGWDTTMKLLVPKSTNVHDTWLQKLQALCVDAYAPIVSLLNEQVEGELHHPQRNCSQPCSVPSGS